MYAQYGKLLSNSISLFQVWMISGAKNLHAQALEEEVGPT